MKKLMIALLAMGFGMSAHAAGDAAAGKAKAEAVCVACHGKDFKGMEAMKAPTLVGKDAAFITEQLKAFRAGTRNTPNAAMMAPNAKGLSDADIDNLAAFLSSLK